MSLNREKTLPSLGYEIHEFLIEKGVESPLVHRENNCKKQIADIGEKFLEILKILNLDTEDVNLKDTPKRIGKMFVNETLWGLNYENFPRIMTVPNTANSAMVVERKINVTSMCAHHWQNILGVCHIAYIPNEKLVGLSKLHRVVEFFSRRPQIQELLVEQIYHALSYILGTDNIAITIIADHLCIRARGVEDYHSDTVTTKLGGLFLNEPANTQEFYNAIKL